VLCNLVTVDLGFHSRTIWPDRRLGPIWSGLKLRPIAERRVLHAILHQRLGAIGPYNDLTAIILCLCLDIIGLPSCLAGISTGFSRHAVRPSGYLGAVWLECLHRAILETRNLGAVRRGLLA